MLARLIFASLFLAWSQPTIAATQEIILRHDLAAGEEWFSPDKENVHLKSPNEKWVRQIRRPVLEIYEPPKPNGSAVVIAPGGGFKFLAIEHEGREVAKWANRLGITAFVLRYRCGLELNKNEKLSTAMNASNAIEDGLLAVKVVRERVSQYKLDAKRIGILGFSAGGYLTLGAATMFSSESRPDFAIAIYPVAPTILSRPKDLPPLFVAAAFDDKLDAILPSVTSLIPIWKSATVPLEMHIFENGGHGFGMNKQNTASDAWPELVAKWLAHKGII